ncbi:MAG: hypothetical protein HY081_08410 [Gammaproteobacteria bacterium]|nr:hypothetical protein [Gammaproteobacteria bacterium]
MNIKVSRFLAATFLFIGLGAMPLVMILPAWPMRFILWLMLGFVLYRLLTIYAWRIGKSAIEVVELDDEASVSVRFAGDELWYVCQVKSRFIHPWLTLLTLRVAGRRLPVKLVIAADAVDAELFRLWRVRLNLETVLE